MNDHCKDVTELLRRLIASMLDKPEELSIETTAFPGRVNWSIRVHIDDQGKVIGKQGAHVKALQFLVALFGIKYSTQFRLTVFDPVATNRGPENVTRIAAKYDTAEAESLLFDLIDEILSSDFADIIISETRAGERLAFNFRIDSLDEKAYQRLVHPCDPTGRGNAQTVIAAIGTLFRAFAQREGVVFTVEVPAR